MLLDRIMLTFWVFCQRHCIIFSDSLVFLLLLLLLLLLFVIMISNISMCIRGSHRQMDLYIFGSWNI